mmetsp:Transcript_25829/g.58716  ORF Transcript_25829/g.58716 Transcript_25829/m.58716 type:complete len:102 (+) Transcript_25829:428-733(+)
MAPFKWLIDASPESCTRCPEVNAPDATDETCEVGHDETFETERDEACEADRDETSDPFCDPLRDLFRLDLLELMLTSDPSSTRRRVPSSSLSLASLLSLPL